VKDELFAEKPGDGFERYIVVGRAQPPTTDGQRSGPFRDIERLVYRLSFVAYD
jgi:hypothetical protein